MINYFKNTSYPNRSNANPTTIKKKTRINPLPFEMANLAPNHEPVTLQIAIGIAIVQMIFPFNTNKVMEPMLVAKLTNFAQIFAFKKSKPRIAIKAIISKLPVPGPMNPS